MSASPEVLAKRQRRAGAARAMQPWQVIGLAAVVGGSFAKTFGSGAFDLFALFGFVVGLLCLIAALVRYFQYLKANPLP